MTQVKAQGQVLETLERGNAVGHGKPFEREDREAAAVQGDRSRTPRLPDISAEKHVEADRKVFLSEARSGPRLAQQSGQGAAERAGRARALRHEAAERQRGPETALQPRRRLAEAGEIVGQGSRRFGLPAEKQEQPVGPGRARRGQKQVRLLRNCIQRSMSGEVRLRVRLPRPTIEYGPYGLAVGEARQGEAEVAQVSREGIRLKALGVDARDIPAGQKRAVLAGHHAGGDERLPVQDIYEAPHGHGLTSGRRERI